MMLMFKGVSSFYFILFLFLNTTFLSKTTINDYRKVNGQDEARSGEEVKNGKSVTHLLKVS